MGRTRKGRDVSGWVIIDKPAGLTSTAVVNKIRWAFDAKKPANRGPWNPGRTGLLAERRGERRKTIPLFQMARKASNF